MYGAPSASGIPVSRDTAMTWAIVWACVQIKSQDMAKIPLPLYKRLGKNGEDGREEAIGHPVWALLREQPNKYMTPYVFRQTMQGNKDTQGNAYAVIERDGNGTPVALWPRDPGYFSPTIKNGELVYEYTLNGERKYMPTADVFHLKGFTRDGINGLSPIEYFRDGIGLGLGYQQHAAHTFKNQARPSLVASTANVTLGADKAKEIATALTQQYAGASNAGKVIVAYGGMELKPWGFSNRDAEYINAARLSNEDACRIWRMPPHKAMDYTQSAYANMATASEEYVNDTLRPDQVNWEEEIFAKLISRIDRARYYAEHNNDALLKGTPTERATVENTRLMNGTSTINEVRRSHNWKPVDGGDKNRTQMQMVPIDAPLPEVKEDAKEPRSSVTVNLGQPAIEIHPSAVTVEGVRFTAPEIKIPDVSVSANIQMPGGKKQIIAVRDASGRVIGATATEVLDGE